MYLPRSCIILGPEHGGWDRGEVKRHRVCRNLFNLPRTPSHRRVALILVRPNILISQLLFLPAKRCYVILKINLLNVSPPFAPSPRTVFPLMSRIWLQSCRSGRLKLQSASSHADFFDYLFYRLRANEGMQLDIRLWSQFQRRSVRGYWFQLEKRQKSTILCVEACGGL